MKRNWTSTASKGCRLPRDVSKCGKLGKWRWRGANFHGNLFPSYFPSILLQNVPQNWVFFFSPIFCLSFAMRNGNSMMMMSTDEIVERASGISIIRKYVANSLSRDGGPVLSAGRLITPCEITHGNNMKFHSNRIENSSSVSIIEFPFNGDGKEALLYSRLLCEMENVSRDFLSRLFYSSRYSPKVSSVSLSRLKRETFTSRD